MGLIGKHGLMGEKHEVKTPSGYVIQVFRIPSKNPNAPVAYLQHGLMFSSDIFAMANNSMALALADNAVDVWIGNARGNVYARHHEKLSVEDDKFWDFSWHEMGTSDLPAVVDYILAKTKKNKLSYIGHSMGTTMLFVMLAEKPEYNEKISNMVALAPIVYCSKYQFIVSNGSSMHMMIKDAFDKLKENKKWEAFPRSDVAINNHQMRCSDLPEMAISYCTMVMEMATNKSQNRVPAGSSVKCMRHYAQSYVMGKISQFNYKTPEENQKMYNSNMPPSYNLKNVKIPVHIFYAESDQLLDESDVDSLANDLPNVAFKLKLPNENFNHIDFVYKSSEDIDDAYNIMITRVKEIVMK